MTESLFPEPRRAVRSRKNVYRVVLQQPLGEHPAGWTVLHRFTRTAANAQVYKLAELGVPATIQRGRISWENEADG